MADKYDSIEKIRFIHGLMKKEVEELIRFIGTSRLEVPETQNPPMDIIINEKEAVIYADMPGITTEDFTVYQYEDLFVIEGVKPKINVPNVSYIRVERENIKFKRVIRLPFYVGDAEINAKLKNGVLEVRIARGEN